MAPFTIFSEFMMRAILLVCLLNIWISSAVTHAQEPNAERSFSPYHLHIPRDVSLTLGAGIVWLLPEFFLEDIVDARCPCDQEAINPWDRPYAGKRNLDIAHASNLFVGTLAVGAVATEWWQAHTFNAPTHELLKDILVISQSITINGAIGQVTKLMVQRPRPLLYNNPRQSELREPDNYLSFYSAHTSNVAAAGFALAYTLSYRFDAVWQQYLAYSSASLATLVTGWSRIESGKHFPTDVAMGAVIGAVTGLAIPSFHRSKEWQLSLVPTTPQGIGLVFHRNLR